MMFTIEEADDYFELHLKYDFWKSLDQQTKNAALQCAENDIKNFLALECIDETSVFAYCAVLEQAVYLAEYFDVLNSPRELKAESVDGVGKKIIRRTKQIPYRSTRSTIPRPLIYAGKMEPGRIF